MRYFYNFDTNDSFTTISMVKLQEHKIKLAVIAKIFSQVLWLRLNSLTLQTLPVMKTGFSLQTFLYREKPLVMKTGFSL